MDYIWESGEVTVRDVHEALQARRDEATSDAPKGSIAYTTVMTTMVRLNEKGLLTRSEESQAHRYSARVTKEEYARSTLTSVMDWLVNQFGEPALAYFLDRVEEDNDRVLDSLREAIEERDARNRRSDD